MDNFLVKDVRKMWQKQGSGMTLEILLGSVNVSLSPK
jgi:hypothetical protein